jgi:hypothetical protein
MPSQDRSMAFCALTGTRGGRMLPIPVNLAWVSGVPFTIPLLYGVPHKEHIR